MRFLQWFFVTVPKRIYKISFNITKLVNNQFSFTLNLKLIFTPLYGDYTVIGRGIGFMMRIIFIFSSVFFVGFLFLMSFILPLMWYLLPFVLFDEYGILGIVLLLIVSVFLYILETKNTPEKKLTEDINSPLQCFTHNAKNTISSFGNKTFTKREIVRFLTKAELNTPEFISTVNNFGKIDKPRLYNDALEIAKRFSRMYVHEEHVFLSLLKQNPDIERILNEYASTFKLLESTADWIVEEKEKLYGSYFWQDDYNVQGLSGFGHGLTGRVTPNLDSISTDYTEFVKKGYIKNIVGRSNEIEKIAKVLAGTNTNVLLLGAPGSGKTSIVKGLAQEIAFGTKYKSLENKRLVELGLGGMVSGARNTGEIAEKINRAMGEIKGSRDIILFIDEIHNLGTGLGEDSEVSSIFAIMEPHLSSNDLQFIGATSYENYKKYVEPNSSFARLFEIIEIPEASEEDTLMILKGIVPSFETKFKITITYPSLVALVQLSKQLIHERVFPDKAVDILSRTCDFIRNNAVVLTAEDVKREISEFTHIPVSALNEDETAKLMQIEEMMKKKVIGQDNALRLISNAIKRARVGIRNEDKPIASFLFVGTTGVGKTETAKTLADTYFGDKKAMIRVDMSEYQTADSINKLIGNSDGSSLGILTSQISAKPYTVVLLDEIEKAHPQILLTFLQVLDDGRLTNSKGHTIDFTHTIIIATSNTGTREIQEVSEKGGTYLEMEQAAMSKVRQNFAPEFLNRFSSIIVFNPLTKENIAKIANIMLEKIKSMTVGKNMEVSFSPILIEKIIEKGYSKEWGARPMARLIEDTVETYIAEKILTKEFVKGGKYLLGEEVFNA